MTSLMSDLRFILGKDNALTIGVVNDEFFVQFESAENQMGKKENIMPGFTSQVYRNRVVGWNKHCFVYNASDSTFLVMKPF